MSGCKKLNIIVILVLLFSAQAFSQQINYGDSLAHYNSVKAKLKPVLNYSVGSTFAIVPHVGSVVGFTFSPSLSVPLSPNWSVDGGIIAGRYYSSLPGFNPEGAANTFNALSIYGSASYHINPQLTVYGAGIKQLAGSAPFDYLPKSSYVVGSTYKFGNFSIGLNVQISKWNDNLNTFPFNRSQGLNSPFRQGPAGF